MGSDGPGSDGSQKREPFYHPAWRQLRRNARGYHDTVPELREISRARRRQIEDAVNDVKWTEHDRWIKESWDRALCDMRLRHLVTTGIEVNRAPQWCRMNPRDKEEIVGLMVELIQSDRRVQRALLDWACRSPYRSSWG